MTNRIKRTIIYMVLAALLITGLCGCTTWDNFRKAFIDPDTDTKEKIRIAVLEPLTGTDAREAAAEVAGIELAHDKYGTVLGKTVELVCYDTKSDIEELKEAAEKLCGEDISLVLGCYGNAMTIAAGDIFKEHSMPAIAITCTNPLITRTNPFYARACCIDLDEAACAADFVYSCLGTDKAAILTQRNNDYSKAKGEQFAKRLGEISGRDYIPVTAFDPQHTDLEAILRAFALSGTTTVYFPEDAETAKSVISKARELLLEFDWVGPSDWDGSGLEDVYFTVDYAADGQQSYMTEDFNKAYAEKYGQDRIPPEETALGFDAYLIAINGIASAQTEKDGALIAQKIREIKGLAGATGSINMSEIGDPVKSIMINKSSGGKQTTVFTVDTARYAEGTQTTDNSNDTESEKEQQ